MNQDQVKGRVRQVKGKLQQGAGKAAGDEDLRSRGKAEQGVGNTQAGLGRGKEKLKDAIDKV